MTLIAKEKEDYAQTHPDYDAFIILLQYCNTKDLNYVAKRLNDNKRKFFAECADSEKEKFLNDIRDFHRGLVGAQSKALPLLESVIVDWANNLFLDK